MYSDKYCIHGTLLADHCKQCDSDQNARRVAPQSVALTISQSEFMLRLIDYTMAYYNHRAWTLLNNKASEYLINRLEETRFKLLELVNPFLSKS